jgi:hypothetical protein
MVHPQPEQLQACNLVGTTSGSTGVGGPDTETDHVAASYRRNEQPGQSPKEIEMSKNIGIGTVVELYNPQTEKMVLRGKVIDITLQWNVVMQRHLPLVDIKELDDDFEPTGDIIQGVEEKDLSSRRREGYLEIIERIEREVT